MMIRDYLKKYKLITDGSFGTYYSSTYQTYDMPEAANLEHEDRVLSIHRSYLESGARLIRTNTFASNTVLLNSSLEDVKNNLRAAVRLAKQAVSEYQLQAGKIADGSFSASDQEIYIAGDIGPIPNNSQISSEDIPEEYYQIAKTFIEEGLSILTFETFPDLLYALPAIQRICAETDVFIMVQFRIDQFGYSGSGMNARKLIQQAAAVPEIDAVGLNCGVGPGHMSQIYHKIPLPQGKYAIALPNSGYPKRNRGQLEYANNPKYFAAKAKDLAAYGIDIVGGCCGTNPTYIKYLTETVDITQHEKPVVTTETKSPEIPARKTGFFYHPDGSLKEKKLIAVELAPPTGANDEKLLEAAYILQNADVDVDVLTFPDSPSGRTRIDSVLMAEKVKLATGMAVMPHICCRDKNAIAMRSLFLGAHINNINNMLLITGDPIPSTDRETVKSVFNFDSVGLMNIALDMNEENFPDVPLTYGGAINQGRRNLDIEIGRVRKKMAAGAQFFFTQPVFSTEEADRIRRIKDETGARILCGIMPLISRRNALFMKNEISGISITDDIIDRYPENGTKEEGEAVGVAIAREMIAYTQDFVDGYYFSFPFNRVYLLEQVLKSE
jgi:homocysteine S-methyltransferase